MRLLPVVLVLFLAACSSTSTWSPSPPLPLPPFHKVFVSVDCERCDRPALQSLISSGVAAALPNGQIVLTQKDSDTIIKYSEGDSLIVLDAPSDFEYIPQGIRVHPNADLETWPRWWGWSGEIYRAPGRPSDLTVTLYGHVSKLRGHAAKYFLRQVKELLR